MDNYENENLRAEILDCREALHRQAVLLQETRQTLARVTNLVCEQRPTLEEIKRATADYFGLAQEELTERRTRTTAHARLVVYYLARRLTPLSFQNIADRMGRKHHSTILIGCERLAKKARRDEYLFDELEAIRVRIAAIVTNRVAQGR
jgi:chromosomal replication initiator protein